MVIHHFAPTHYFNAIGSHEPVLRIASGDSVVTTTLDASGRDAAGDERAERGNPMTGPFFVDGAYPGDALHVTIDRLTPIRDWGFTWAPVAVNVVDPEFVRDLPEREQNIWTIDLEAGRIALANPSARLRDLSLPLAPMIGCFGVAPARGQAISTATSAEHGGNMDYRGFAPGVTAIFPVFVEGALFHLGDGHATQGDGEIVGTGVETAFEMAFTVRVEPGAASTWPRGITEREIFTAGNARPLDQALQHATTEMMRWLASDYGLDANDASHLLGQVVRYDIGNVFDPAYTVVCRLEKRWLS
ncbi:MAG: acetamidase/formamidase family protein [Chloroflexota bacterium]|nr:acetamidase/formamidase family protein [Chloroflexota bacterium]